jgi:type VI secretion system protein ImpM
VDDNKWAGIMLPSVDRVGRYFPISVASKLSSDTNIVDTLSSQSTWFGEIEDIALKGLEGILDVDGVFAEIQQKPISLQPGSYVRNTSQGASAVDSIAEAGLSTHMAIQMDFEEQLPSSVNSYVLEWFVSQHLPSYSMWHATGSERVPPSFLISQGLPAVRGAAAMLAGDWQKWNWQMPFNLVPDTFG